MTEDPRIKETKGAEEAYGGTGNTEPASASTFSRDGGLLIWLTDCSTSFYFLELGFDA